MHLKLVQETKTKSRGTSACKAPRNGYDDYGNVKTLFNSGISNAL